MICATWFCKKVLNSWLTQLNSSLESRCWTFISSLSSFLSTCLEWMIFLFTKNFHGLKASIVLIFVMTLHTTTIACIVNFIDIKILFYLLQDSCLGLTGLDAIAPCGILSSIFFRFEQLSSYLESLVRLVHSSTKLPVGLKLFSTEKYS